MINVSIQSYIHNSVERGRSRLPKRFETDRTYRGYDVEGIILILPVFIFFAGVSAFPILYGLWLSTQGGTGAVDLTFVGFANYIDVLQREAFWLSVGRGVYYAVFTVVLQLVIGVSVALALNQQMKFINFIRAFVFVPYMVPTVVVAAVFAWILQQDLGVLNWVLVSTGILENRINFLGSGNVLGVAWAMHTAIWASTWKWTIFVILLVLARLQSIDPILYEAAKTNGAGMWRQFVDVTLPQIKNVLFLVILLRVIWQFSNFEMIFLLTQGGPFSRTTTTVIYAYQVAFGSFDFGVAAAITTLIFMLLLTFAVIYFVGFNPGDEVEVRE